MGPHLIYRLIFLSIFCIFSVMAKTFAYDIEFDLKPISIRRQMVWRALIDWHDPRNWQPDYRIPCALDRIALPEDYILFLNYPLDTTELVLPQNGELILGPHGNIRLMTTDEEDTEHSCPPGISGSDLEFHPFRDGVTSWFSPIHWQLVYQTPDPSDYRPLPQMEWTISSPISNYATFISSSKLTTSIVPHSERIPCTGDWVHFPVTNGSFKVTIERSSQIPAIGSLTIGSTQFHSSAQFGEFAKSFRGEMLFDIRDYNHLTILGPGLSESSGCGNDAPKKLETICRAVAPTCSSTQPLPCTDPITPMGHCCPICASSLVVRPKKVKYFSDLTLYRSIFGHMREMHQNIANVRLYGHWLYDGSFQVIVDNLQPNGEPLNDRYVTSLKQLVKDKNAFLYNEVELDIQSSIEWISDSHVMSSVVWFFFILFVLSVAAIPLYAYYQRNRLDPAFTFVRFRSATSDIELEVDPAGSHQNGQSDIYSTERSFPGPPTLFKSSNTIPHASIASIKSLVTNTDSNVSLASGSLFPIVPLSISAAAHDDPEDKITSDHFDNPIFRLYSEQQQKQATAGTTNVDSSYETTSAHKSTDN